MCQALLGPLWYNNYVNACNVQLGDTVTAVERRKMSSREGHLFTVTESCEEPGLKFRHQISNIPNGSSTMSPAYSRHFMSFLPNLILTAVQQGWYYFLPQLDDRMDSERLHKLPWVTQLAQGRGGICVARAVQHLRQLPLSLSFQKFPLTEPGCSEQASWDSKERLPDTADPAQLA